MSVEVETRGRGRFLPRGMRRLLGTDNRQISTSAVEIAPNAPVGHVYAMFQNAQNTTIQSPNFYINAAETSAGATSRSDSRTLQQFTSRQETLNPTRSIPLSAGPVLPSEPIPAPKNNAEVYMRHLMTKNLGYPLWTPSPNTRLSASYRASGISIGDVGIITPEGAFSYLFNVFHEASHPINAAMRLPKDFVPFARDAELLSSDIETFIESRGGGHIADESLLRVDAGDDTSKTILKTSAAHAAVLMTPEPVYASKLQCTIPFRKYIHNNIRSWYRFVKTVLGRDVDNGAIRVVEGCRKSTAFGVATVANDGVPDESTELTFSVDHSWVETTGTKYRWDHRGSGVLCNCGPSLAENQEILRDLTRAGGHGLQSDLVYRNQCLFVDTVDVTLQEGEWRHINDDELVSVTATEFLNRQSHSASLPARHSTSPKGVQPNSGHSSSAGSRNGGRIDGLPQQTASTVGRPDERESWPTISPSEQRLFHPSDVLAQFLLWIVPQATSVALRSDDWGPYMTGSVQTVGALIDNVLSAHYICEDDGMIYLSPKESHSPAERQRSTDVATESLAEGNPPHDSSSGSAQYTEKAIEQRMAIVSSFLRLMLLKTPSANLRPYHVIVKLSDIMAVMAEISGSFLQCDMLSTLQVIFPWTRAERYIMQVSNDSGGNSEAIAHTSTSSVMKFGNQMVTVFKSPPSQVARIKQNTEIEQVEEDWSDPPETSVHDISKTNTLLDSPPQSSSYSFHGSNSSHSKDNRSGGRTYRIPNYATSYANKRSNLISVTSDEDKKTSKGIAAIAIVFLLFAVVLLSWAMRRPINQDIDSFHKSRDARRENVRVEVQGETNGRREAAQPIIKSAEDPGPHLDLKASQPYWDEIKPAEHCTAFGTREYTAKLKNVAWTQNAKWRQVCENTWVSIHEANFKPTKCERKWPLGEIIGHWSLNFGEPGCEADWGSFTDKGCVQKGSRLRRFQSRLWNIQAGENWVTICTTAPATIRGVNLAKPTKCDDQGLWGIYGTWDVEDESC